MRLVYFCIPAKLSCYSSIDMIKWGKYCRNDNEAIHLLYVWVYDDGEANGINFLQSVKTGFIKEWWENASKVTLITRPRRFGKTHQRYVYDK